MNVFMFLCFYIMDLLLIFMWDFKIVFTYRFLTAATFGLVVLGWKGGYDTHSYRILCYAGDVNGIQMDGKQSGPAYWPRKNGLVCF